MGKRLVDRCQVASKGEAIVTELSHFDRISQPAAKPSAGKHKIGDHRDIIAVENPDF